MTISCINAVIDGQPSFAITKQYYRARVLRGLGVLLSLLMLSACGGAEQPTLAQLAVAAAETGDSVVKLEESRMWMIIGERRFAITLTDNSAAHGFAALLPLTLDMAELNGNEKYANLPNGLATNASQPGTIRNGDLMLYGADTLVVFYLTFDSSYSYTRLGRVDDPAGLVQALGRQGIRIVFSKNP